MIAEIEGFETDSRRGTREGNRIRKLGRPSPEEGNERAESVNGP